MKNLLYVLILTMLAISCAENSRKSSDNNENTSTKITADSLDSTINTESVAATYTLKARFVEFVLGDAEHYKFEDESGNIWDFSGCETGNFDFTRELPEGEADESNQGWGSNLDLQGRWFVLTYYKEERPQYIDGPIVVVSIISEAVASE